jgi:RNA polymerase sigma-70 factor (ECF subfamily)
MNETTPEGHRTETFEHYRALLFSIAYRMTSSANDAEDLTQETYLRYQAGLGRLQEAGRDIVSLKAYLTTIVTRLALDHLKSARVTREQYIGTWLPEPLLTAGCGDLPLADLEADLERRETLSLAFLRVLEVLSPSERAVFLMHEVFDYPFSEIGAMLAKSPVACRQILHRAKLALREGSARFTPEPRRQRELLLGFLAAAQAGDMAALTSLLAEDTISWSDAGGKARAPLTPLYGRQATAHFWTQVVGENLRRLTITLDDGINGGPALLSWDAGRLIGVLLLTASDAGIQEIYALVNPDKLVHLRKQLTLRIS